MTEFRCDRAGLDTAKHTRKATTACSRYPFWIMLARCGISVIGWNTLRMRSFCPVNRLYSSLEDSSMILVACRNTPLKLIWYVNTRTSCLLEGVHSYSSLQLGDAQLHAPSTELCFPSLHSLTLKYVQTSKHQQYDIKPNAIYNGRSSTIP